jgi:hypothetical protein
MQELDQGLLFPRFSHIYGVSATVTAQVAEHMVAAGEGSEPVDFTNIVKVAQSAGKPAGMSAWELYVRHNMFSPINSSRL